jgi:hypothetical protein
MKTVWLVVLVVLSLWGSVVSAQNVKDSLGGQESYVFLQGLAGNDAALGRVGWKPADSRVAAFVQVSWLKDMDGKDMEGWGVHIGATFDIVSQQALKVFQWEVPVTWYIGAIAGMVKPEKEGIQTSPGLLTGVKLFGKDVGKSPSVVLELWHLPGKTITDAWPDITSSGRILVGAGFPF